MVTHGFTVGRVQHGSWEAEQAEELGVAPLLRWQVPARVDRPQRQQCCRHRLRTEDKSKGRIHIYLDPQSVTVFCK